MLIAGATGKMGLEATLTAARPHRTAIDIGHAFGAAQRNPVGLHHGRQHLLAGADAQPVERVLASSRTPWIGNDSCTCAAGTTRSAGFVRDFISVAPLVCLLGNPHGHMRVKGAATSAHAFSRFWDIAQVCPSIR